MRATPIGSSDPSVADLLLDGLAALEEWGDHVGVPRLQQALSQLTSGEPVSGDAFSWLPIAWMVAAELFDDATWQVLSCRWVSEARHRGDVTMLPVGLGRFPYFDVVVGRFAAAERAFTEAREIAAAIGGTDRLGAYSASEIAALAWRGREAETRAAVEALTGGLSSLGRGVGVRMVQLALAILELGLGNYPRAFHAARAAHGDDPLVHLNSAPELIEAAVRCGEREAARPPLERLVARADACSTDWARGVSLRSQALLAGDQDAEELYRAAIEHLDRSLVVPQLGRAHLLYGEWLRRRRRRRDAREQLRTAHELLRGIGAEAFAARARVELLATGEHPRKRTVDTRDRLTPQEEQVARLAIQGASNQEIASQLFISSATVAYHLQKTFRKLDVTNRVGLVRALSDLNANGANGREVAALDTSPALAKTPLAQK